MKLGLILKITNGGESETYSINKQEAWARYASDARSAIKELQGFDGSDKTVYLLKFLGGVGYLLSVIKSRPEGSGRPNDNTAAWIFVPSSAVVSACEMEQVLKKVEEAISESKGIDKCKLDEAFSKDYDTKNVLVSAVGSIASTADGNYALRYYNGDYRLNELLGEHLAQTEYGRYKGVFFVENNSGIGLSTNDVLNFEPKQFITISPLKSVGGFAAGFLSSKGFVKFDKEIELATGTKITIEWRKENYAPILKTFTAGKDNTANLEIKDSECQIRIQRSWFIIQDSNGNPIPNANISINHQLMSGEYLDIAERLLVNLGILIDIQAKGFEEYHESVQQITPNKLVELRPRRYESEYIVPIYSGERCIAEAKLTFATNQKISTSPLKGYEIHNKKYLEYNVSYMSKFKTFAYGFISCLLIILLWAGYQAMDNYEFQFGWPPFKHIAVLPEPTDGVGSEGEDIDAQNDSLRQKAVTYLDTHKSWNKDSLDNNEVTSGLYDELDGFKIDEIKERIEEKQLSSQNLQKVYVALQKNQENGFDPHEGKFSNGGNYNSPSDKNINIDNYVKWLSVKHVSKVDTQPESISSSTSFKKNVKSQITRKPTITNKVPKGEGSSATSDSRGRLN